MSAVAKFWFLLAIAFFDLVVALVLAGRGYSSPAYLFLLMAALVGGYAVFSGPQTRRDSRGRLQSAELPYAGVLGTVGAVAILASAWYVAVSTTSPAPMAAPSRPVVSRMPAAAPEPPYVAPRSFNPSPNAAVIYKCVDARGHASYQSQPCAGAAEQAWVRDATPEPPPTRAQQIQRARAQRETASRSAQSDIRWQGQTSSANSGSADPGQSSACQAARAADAAYRRQPLRYVTHDGLRRHGDAIHRACY